jgi:hypothetical protein
MAAFRLAKHNQPCTAHHMVHRKRHVKINAVINQNDRLREVAGLD